MVPRSAYTLLFRAAARPVSRSVYALYSQHLVRLARSTVVADHAQPRNVQLPRLRAMSPLTRSTRYSIGLVVLECTASQC